MDVLEAIQTRHSVRDFLPKPVPQDTLLCILEAATRCPSGGNGQPWEIYVASGKTLEAIRAAYLARAAEAPAGPPPRPAAEKGPLAAPPPRPAAEKGPLAAPPFPPPPGSPGTPPPAFIRERMEIIRNERMKLLGLDPADPASGKVFMEWGARLYGAPAVVVLCMDQSLNSHFDIGMLAQSICLAAQGFGVDSIIAAAFIRHPDVLYKELAIPATLKVVTGIGLGYANPGSVINTYRSPRRPIQEVVRLKN
jgi:nitroreductase